MKRDAKIVTIDGKKYWEWIAFGNRVRKPVVHRHDDRTFASLVRKEKRK